MCGPRTMIIEGDVAQVDSYGTVVSLADPVGAGGGDAQPENFNRWFLRRLDSSWKVAGRAPAMSHDG
jgi:hypothetical protein